MSETYEPKTQKPRESANKKVKKTVQAGTKTKDGDTKLSTETPDPNVGSVGDTLTGTDTAAGTTTTRTTATGGTATTSGSPTT